MIPDEPHTSSFMHLWKEIKNKKENKNNNRNENQNKIKENKKIIMEEKRSLRGHQ